MIIQKILKFLDTQAATPKYFGLFHIIWILIAIAASVCLWVLWKKEKIKKPDKVILITSLVLLVLGIYKQVVLSFEYDSAIKFAYDWANFPWNFLSVPLCIGILIGVTSGNINKHFLSYFATFGLLAGIGGLFNPDVFVSTIGINVYHMLCYGAFIALAVLIIASEKLRIEMATFYRALPVFIMVSGIAISFNEVAHLIFPGYKVSLFDISRHSQSDIPLYSAVHNFFLSTGNGITILEYLLCVLLYWIFVSAFVLVPLLILIAIKKLSNSDSGMVYEKKDELADGLRKSTGLNAQANFEDIFSFKGKVNSNENTYRITYFKNLLSNFGNNKKGSCGYVAMAMLLSYYDTILSDKIVPRQFEKPSMSHDDPDFTESPGSRFYQFEYNPAEMNHKDYIAVVNKAKNTYLHEKLLSIAIEKNYHDIIDGSNIDFGSNPKIIKDILDDYLKNIANVKKSEYDIRVLDNSQKILESQDYGKALDARKYSEEVRKYTIKQIKKGYPVLLGVFNEDEEGHGVIAYDYDPIGDKIYCHIGWDADRSVLSKQNSHKTIEDEGFCYYGFAIVLDFDEDKFSHTHLNNYEVVIGDALFYYCPDGAYTTSDDIVVEFGPEKKTLSIVGVYNNGKYPKDNLEIPEYIGNVRVTNIAPGAFKNQEHITRLLISAEISMIPKSAFAGCKLLSTAIIPSSVISIDKDAFKGCETLENIIYLGTKNQWQQIKKSDSWNSKTGMYKIRCFDGVLFKLNADCHGDFLENEIELPSDKISKEQINAYSNLGKETIGKIAKHTLNRSGSLIRAIIFDSISEIPKNEFENQKLLATVEIPASVKRIRSDAFKGCIKLSNVIYHGTKEQWLDIKKSGSWDEKTGDYRIMCSDGVLSKNSKELQESSVEASKGNFTNKLSDPEQIKAIKYPDLAKYAFDDKGHLTHAIITDDASQIPKEAFEDQKHLTTVIIPKNVTKIRSQAFKDCRKLSHIIYLGNKDSWFEIERSSSWDSDSGNYIVCCVDGSITKALLEQQKKSKSKKAPLGYLGHFAVYPELENYEYVVHPKEYVSYLRVSPKTTAIQNNTFDGWSMLKIVEIPVSVKKIGADVFSGCSNLTDILYAGTKKQWKKIKKDPLWDNKTVNYMIRCQDGAIEKSEKEDYM